MTSLTNERSKALPPIAEGDRRSRVRIGRRMKWGKLSSRRDFKPSFIEPLTKEPLRPGQERRSIEPLPTRQSEEARAENRNIRRKLAESETENSRLSSVVAEARNLLQSLLSSDPPIESAIRVGIENWLDRSGTVPIQIQSEAFEGDFAILRELEGLGIPLYSDQHSLPEEEQIEDPYEWLRRYYSDFLRHFGAPVDRLFQFQLGRYDSKLLKQLTTAISRGKIAGVKRIREILGTKSDYLKKLKRTLPPDQLKLSRRLAANEAQRTARRRKRS